MLPPLTAREKRMYRDTFTAYAPVRDANWNITTFIIATNTDGTLLSDINCNFHLTPNFDQPRSPAGQDKVTNYETSNLLTCQRAITLDPDWQVEGVTRWGDSVGPFAIDGTSEQEVLVPCTCVFLVPGI